MAALAEQRDDGDARVTTNNGDFLVGRVGTLDLANEATGTDDVEGSDTEESLGVVHATGLEDLCADGDGRVDGVGYDEEVGLGAGFGTGLGKIADDGGVCVEEVVTSHARFARDTGGNDDDIATLQSVGEASSSGLVTLDGALGVYVRDISSNTYRKKAELEKKAMTAANGN